MGCDGGTIPTRDELVKLKKKPEQKDADAVRLLKWAHCALSQQVSPTSFEACFNTLWFRCLQRKGWLLVRWADCTTRKQ